MDRREFLKNAAAFAVGAGAGAETSKNLIKQSKSPEGQLEGKDVIKKEAIAEQELMNMRDLTLETSTLLPSLREQFKKGLGEPISADFMMNLGQLVARADILIDKRLNYAFNVSKLPDGKKAVDEADAIVTEIGIFLEHLTEKDKYPAFANNVVLARVLRGGDPIPLG